MPQPDNRSKQRRIMVCIRGQCAPPKQGRQLEKKLQALIVQHGLDDPEHPQYTTCTVTNCLAVCEHGPVMIVHPEGVKYKRVDEAALARIFESHILQGEPVEALAVRAVSSRQISTAIERLLRGDKR